MRAYVGLDEVHGGVASSKAWCAVRLGATAQPDTGTGDQPKESAGKALLQSHLPEQRAKPGMRVEGF